ncbi:hypothetical protein LOAG_07681 [Loa loa]|uniref:Uncharacterized protein n=1 Tax=Loa loa TaxID=7209 RepID=A0A1S0TX04_LOALO|nr:hypothetical protein LOAG_07681 [Loa loa]EFO20812.1 hypothetical protein LOAG_07681 [Loa loa]
MDVVQDEVELNRILLADGVLLLMLVWICSQTMLGGGLAIHITVGTKEIFGIKKYLKEIVKKKLAQPYSTVTSIEIRHTTHSRNKNELKLMMIGLVMNVMPTVNNTAHRNYIFLAEMNMRNSHIIDI